MVGMGTGQYTDNDDVIVKGSSNVQIGQVEDRLKTISCLQSKTKIVPITSSVTLTTGSFTSCYTYTGSGLLIGFSMEFNNVSIIPRLKIDGQTVFDTLTISQWGGFAVTNNTTDRRQNGQGLVVNSANIDFSFRLPIYFASSVVFEADANGGASLSRMLSQGVVFLSQVT